MCDNLSRLLGKDKAEKFFREVGKTHYEELKKQGLIKVDKDPLKTLESIVDYLQSSGYMRKIVISKLSESEVVVDMFGVSVLDSSMRLTDEGKAPSHIMTNTMFAALEDLGHDVDIIDLAFDKGSNHVREKWVIKRR